MTLLDTHIFLWWLSGKTKLTAAEHEALDVLSSQNRLCISAITVWEIEILDRKGKISLNPDFVSWIEKIINIPGFEILPITVQHVVTQKNLPASFHFDPADRLLSATSLITGYPLATKDQKIIDSETCKIWSL
ncbi:MAG: type II toxin-antitoxin system VapC family toxin [Balneolaceae bacterium]